MIVIVKIQCPVFIKCEIKSCSNDKAIAVGILFETLRMSQIVAQIPVSLGIEIRPVIFLGKIGFEPMGNGFYFNSFKMKVNADPGALPFGIVRTVKARKRSQGRNGLITICDF